MIITTFCFPLIARTFKNHKFIIDVFIRLSIDFGDKYNLIITIGNNTKYEKYLLKNIIQ